MGSVREIRVGNATLGGAFGARSGLLAGSIFYDRHSIVEDGRAGVFDQQRAADLLALVDRCARRYGTQMAVDVVAPTPEAMERYFAFTVQRTSLPLLINATDVETRMAGLEAAATADALGRCIYASLMQDTEDPELDALRTHRPAAVMVLACDIGDLTPDGTLAMMRDV